MYMYYKADFEINCRNIPWITNNSIHSLYIYTKLHVVTNASSPHIAECKDHSFCQKNVIVCVK